MSNVSKNDSLYAHCIAPANSGAALDALNELVYSFAPPDATQVDLWELYQTTQYLLQPERDVYLGYLAPTTVQ